MRRLSVAAPTRSVSSSTVAQKQVGTDHRAVGAGQAALRHLVPPGVLVVAVEDLLEPLGVERVVHAPFRRREHRPGGVEVLGLGGAVGHARGHLGAALGPDLHHEIVAAVADHLGEREVEAGAGLGPRPHRRAEAGAGRRAAAHGEHERGLAARAVGGVHERPPEEHAVLHEDRGELARAHAHEGVARGRRRVGLGHEPALVATGPPAHDRRRVQVALPGVGPDRVAEEGRVVASLQAVAAAVLLVGPAHRQVGGPADLGEDDGAVTDGGAEERVAALAQGAEEGVELASLDDQGVAGFHQEPLQSPEGCANETPRRFSGSNRSKRPSAGRTASLICRGGSATREKLAVSRSAQPATRPP